MRSALSKLLLLLVALALVAAACGSDSDDSDESSAATDEMDEEMEDMDDDMDDMDMNMGDPDATPAYEVEGAELTTGTFVLLDTRPDGYDDLIGEANLARHENGTTVTIELSGLLPGVDFISHVHEGECEEGGGDHYKFDPEGSDMPPNEIHLAFTSTGEGTGFMTAENDMAAGDDARSVVVHPAELIDNKIACAPL